MSTITLTKESHESPTKFRAKYDDELIALGIATAAIKTIEELKETDFVIFDKHENFGGTWWANTYPGCASDIPAIWYSFSHSLATNWSKVQPPQYEMEEYLLRIVDEYNLKEKARFKTSVDLFDYNEKTGLWTLSSHDLKTGQKIEHIFFGGKYMHSAVWDHSVDFKGKDVVVVGNGCSAVQVVPALLNDPQYNVGSLTQVFSLKALYHATSPLFSTQALSFDEFPLLCDIIVACTGYDLHKSGKLPAKTTTGVTVSDLWANEGTTAYRTILVKDVPNLFLIGGPNSGTGHSSVVMALENAIDYYIKVAKPVIKGEKKSVVVKPEAYNSWRVTIQNELKKSVFGTKFGGCVSWYSNERENPTAFAWSQVYYWYITHFPNYKDLIYENYKKKAD
ncbi:Pyridine nucleotide-disulfide oxidoreductase family protein [Candida parapsilosis]|nr:Pyridine nucleotide-disulfide oxidoreductase family protein [Candida parapsilosis]